MQQRKTRNGIVSSFFFFPEDTSLSVEELRFDFFCLLCFRFFRLRPSDPELLSDEFDSDEDELEQLSVRIRFLTVLWSL